MEKHIELGQLLDIYGGALTARQRSVLAQTVNEDCSLAEIAEREGISRQGVHDALMRGENQLYAMEKSLGVLRLRRSLRALREKAETAPRAEILRELDALMENGED